MDRSLLGTHHHVLQYFLADNPDTVYNLRPKENTIKLYLHNSVILIFFIMHVIQQLLPAYYFSPYLFALVNETGRRI